MDSRACVELYHIAKTNKKQDRECIASVISDDMINRNQTAMWSQKGV